MSLHFSHCLRDMMLEKGLSPSEIAENAQVSQSSVLQWLRGLSLPKYESAARVAFNLGDSDLSLVRAALYSWNTRKLGQYGEEARLLSEKDALEKLIHASNELVPPDMLPKLLELWKEQEGTKLSDEELIEDPTQESDLILLPKVSQSVLIGLGSLVTQIGQGQRYLADLEWKEFEDLVAEILEESGWSITPMGYTKDGGIDIIAVKKVAPGIPIEMMVQCKRNSPSRKVGVSIVREVWSVKWQKGFHQAMIATTSTFTRGAKSEAHGWNMDLRDHDAIVNWCKGIKGVRSK